MVLFNRGSINEADVIFKPFRNRYDAGLYSFKVSRRPNFVPILRSNSCEREYNENREFYRFLLLDDKR